MWQDIRTLYKNQLYFYTIAMNSQKMKFNAILSILLLFLFSFFLFFLNFFFQKSSNWCCISYGNVTQNNQNILEKEEQIWKIHISWFQNLQKKTYRNQGIRHKNSCLDKKNRTECPEINPHEHGQFIFFDRGPKKFNRQKVVFSINAAGTTGYPHVKEWSWATPYTIQIN